MYLIKADDIEGAACVDGLRDDAVDAAAFEAVLGQHDGRCHGRRQCGRNDNRHQVQCAQDDLTSITATIYLSKLSGLLDSRMQLLYFFLLKDDTAQHLFFLTPYKP